MSEETVNEQEATEENNIDQEFSAMRAIHDQLAPLTHESRVKILRAITILLDIDERV